MTTYNVNEYIRVRLTRVGREIWESRNEDSPLRLRDLGPKPDEEGWLEAQAWEVMRVFGPHFHLAAEAPFIEYEHVKVL